MRTLLGTHSDWLITTVRMAVALVLSTVNISSGGHAGTTGFSGNRVKDTAVRSAACDFFDAPIQSYTCPFEVLLLS